MKKGTLKKGDAVRVRRQAIGGGTEVKDTKFLRYCGNERQMWVELAGKQFRVSLSNIQDEDYEIPEPAHVRYSGKKTKKETESSSSNPQTEVEKPKMTITKGVAKKEEPSKPKKLSKTNKVLKALAEDINYTAQQAFDEIGFAKSEYKCFRQIIDNWDGDASKIAALHDWNGWTEKYVTSIWTRFDNYRKENDK